MTFKKLLFTATITATAFASMHANAADQTGNASAEIIQAITVTENTPIQMVFMFRYLQLMIGLA